LPRIPGVTFEIFVGLEEKDEPSNYCSSNSRADEGRGGFNCFSAEGNGVGDWRRTGATLRQGEGRWRRAEGRWRRVEDR